MHCASALAYFCEYSKLFSTKRTAKHAFDTCFDEMPPKRTIGRPPLPVGAGRESRLYCRILGSEDLKIQAAATLAGKSKSEWIRQTLLEAAGTAQPEPPVHSVVLPNEDFLD
jgi:hypothetical protein